MANPDWQPLLEELQRWADLGQMLRLWWRDDDAVDATPELESLIARARRFNAPCLLAVISAHAKKTLAERVAREALLSASVHGWAHENHEPVGMKKAEFGTGRAIDVVDKDLIAGRERIAALFGANAAQIFIPPWNRISADAIGRVCANGFSILSTYAAPAVQRHPNKLVQINAEIDPIDWRGSRSLVDEAGLLARVTGAIVDRRHRAAFDEPLGLMTHHLVHDSAIWDFIDHFLDMTAANPAARWYSVHDLVVSLSSD